MPAPSTANRKTVPPTQKGMSPHYQATLKQLQELIAEFIIDEPTNILPQLEIEGDLGIDFEVTFPKLVAQINDEFEISLNPKYLTEDFAETGLTIAELATLVSDESELG
jgi:hypothetical protein